MIQVDPERLPSFLEKLFLSCMSQGIGEYLFQPEAPLKVLVDGKEKENRKIFIGKEVFVGLVTHFSDRQLGDDLTREWPKLADEKPTYSHLLIGKLEWFKVRFRLVDGIPSIHLKHSDVPLGPVEQSTKQQNEETKPTVMVQQLVFPAERADLDPFYTAKDGTIDLTQMDDEALAEWFDTFLDRATKIGQPKIKDLVFNPNKTHPYATVVGGLIPIGSILTRPGAGVHERIVRILLKASNNPEAARSFENMGTSAFETDIAYQTRSKRRYRVNIADVFDGIRDHGFLITMRMLADKPLTVEELGLPPVISETIDGLRMGIVLINGTTGSGKSTTMAAILDHLLKKKSVNLLTVENPIEVLFPSEQYPHSIISQREVGMHTIDGQTAMRSAVRQTLNVAMVGEIRNAVDMALAFDLAISGHLILATLHANTVGDSISRIVEMYPPSEEKKVREVLATQYKMGLAQILVSGTRKPIELVIEIMKMNKDVQDFLLKRQRSDSELSMREIIELYSEVQHTQSLDQALVGLFKAGRISEDVLIFNSPDPDSLIYRQNRLGVQLSGKWDPTGALIEQSLSGVFQFAGRG